MNQTEQFKTQTGEIIASEQFVSSSFRYGAYDVTGGAGNMDKSGTRWVRYGWQGSFALIRRAAPYVSQFGNTYYR